MNIKERKQAILQRLDARRFGHSNESAEKDILEQVQTEFDWNKMVKPPLSAYIPAYGVQQLAQLASDVKLMAKPVQRYKIMNDIMKQFGFNILSSGTNRRVFYCVYDPTIIIKIGSDKVGMADNISEYHLQNILKPFCPKTYDITPDGILALSERVEPMTEKDFKQTWASEIFDLTLSILNKGYIMEDIGGNFYKNWGIRIGFGPVILDYPYIYEVDWSMLKCTFIDPITHIKCDGELDYDYSKGMSEIVCDKCGTRFSARHLAKNLPSNAINLINYRKGKFDMNKEIRVSLRRGNDVVYRSYSEADAAPSVNHVADIVRVTKAKEVESKPKAYASNDKPIEKETPRYHCHTPENRDRSRRPIRDELMPDINRFLLTLEIKHGKGAAIDIARRLGLFYDSDEIKRKLASDEKVDKAPSVEPAKPKAPEQKKPELPKVEAVKEEKHSVTTEDPNRQKDGLFPVKPKTAEEIDAEESAQRSDNSIMGFPGEPLVDTMKLKESIPKIREKVYTRLNGFTKEGDDMMVIASLEKKITEIISPDLEELLSTGTTGLQVMINAAVDHRNKSCYNAQIECLKSPLFAVTIYPDSEMEEDEESLPKSMVAPGINLLDNEGIVTSEKEELDHPFIETDNMQEEGYVPKTDLSKECEKLIKNYDVDNILLTAPCREIGINNVVRRLICDLMDGNKGPYAKVVDEATKFVNAYVGPEEKKQEEAKIDDVLMEDNTVANEL